MKTHFLLYAMALVLGGALAGGYFGRQASASPLDPAQKDRLYHRYARILATIESNAALPEGHNKLVFSSIREMLAQLDPHSHFMDSSEFGDLQDDTSGHYFGLGINTRPLNEYTGRMIVAEPPPPESPAAHAGMRAGDIIVRVDGQSVDDWDEDEVIDHLKGPKGSRVHLTLIRAGEPHPLELDVVRGEIPKNTINYAYHIRPGIGYIRIESFSEQTHREFEKALERLRLDSLEGLILDLRSNPGGSLEDAIGVSEEFLPEGAPILSTRGRDGANEEHFSSEIAGDLWVPLVVLIDPDSASASEIVSGAFQDNDRGLVIGRRSFGKGLVQTLINLSDGSGLALTTAKYYTPSGRCLQRPYETYQPGHQYDWLKGKATRSQEVHFTLAGRKVYGGGGITPDIEVENRPQSRFETDLFASDAFFRFARETTSGLTRGSPEESILCACGATVLERFRQFLSRNGIAFEEKEFRRNQTFLRREIRAELLTLLRSNLEGFKVRAEGDNVIASALELMPKARKMLVKTRSILARNAAAKPGQAH